jgi:hypothetical protein
MNKFFIVGCPRSGTTMLQQALNRHSRIVIPPETTFFIEVYGRSLRAQQKHIRVLNDELEIDLPVPAARVRGEAPLRALFEDMAGRYVQRSGKPGVTHFGEKTPGHLRCLPEVRRLYPESKIILMYRDGRDVALSLTQVPWMHPDLYVAFAMWLYYWRIHRKLLQQRSPNVYYVKYEELVADPERCLRAVLDFLGLPYEAQVVLGNGNCEGIVEREYDWKWRALEPISADRAGRWRNELSSKQIERLERWGRHALLSLGYELATGGQRRLPGWFFPRLGWEMAVLLTRHFATRFHLADLRRLLLGTGVDRGNGTVQAQTGKRCSEGH